MFLRGFKSIKDFVRMLRRHQPLVINWLKAENQYSQGIVEIQEVFTDTAKYVTNAKPCGQ